MASPKFASATAATQINTSSFVVVAPGLGSTPFIGQAQGTSGEFTFGISQDWANAAPTPTANPNPNILLTGQNVSIYITTAVCLLNATQAGWQAGELLKAAPDGSGFGIKAQPGDKYGAIAVTSMAGAGLGLVVVEQGTAGVSPSPPERLWVAQLNQVASSMTTGGVFTNVSLPGSANVGICVGPDNNLWVSDIQQGALWRVTTAGVATKFQLPGRALPFGICTGPDGNLWVNDVGNQIWKVTPAGVATSYVTNADGIGICVGPDNNLWATQGLGVTKITTGGVATNYTLTNSNTKGICAGPDGNLWSSDGRAQVWQITTGGVGTAFSLPGSFPNFICLGSDGNLWVTDAETGAGALWQVTPLGVATKFLLNGPPSGSGPAGICTGPDGNLYVCMQAVGVMQVTTGGVVNALYPSASGPFGISPAPF